MESSPTRSRARAWILTAAAATGIAVGSAGIAAAADSSSSTASTVASSSTSAQDPASLPNGPGETVLTGDTASKVSAAALAAVPGGTIVRVETDSAGSPYEAHVKKSDGTYVTVKLDSSFNVTGIEDGFGAGPNGQAAPNTSTPSTTTG